MKKITTLLLLSLTVFLSACQQDRTYDDFASCLNESGAVFYGAFWCHNCENQLDMFGASKDLLPYQECAQGGKDADPALCATEGISAYPTWRFTDGSELTGTQDFETLSEYSACPLPGEEKSVMLQPAEGSEEGSAE